MEKSNIEFNIKKYIKTDRTTLSRIKRCVIGLLPRKFQCFSIGAEKTGTTTIANMFKPDYRSSHEPDPSKTTKLMIDYVKGIVSDQQVRMILRKRDKLFNLEVESTHHLVHVSDLLPQLFPRAKFIVTIREPYSLLESRLNWHKTPTKSAWREYNEYFFGKYHTHYELEEALLKHNNLFSLDAYLKQYALHYKLISKNIPSERILYIKTAALNNSHERIASFIGIEENTLSISHAKKSKKKNKILQQLDQAFVKSKIWEHCGDLITQFYPESIEFYKD